MAEFQQRDHILVDDSEDSIGPSVSLRGVKTPNKPPEKENRLIVQNNSVFSSNQRTTVSKIFANQSRSRKKNYWTPEETELVRIGFERYGTTCRLIRERLFPDDSPRTKENIRDKIKTMQRRGELPL